MIDASITEYTTLGKTVIEGGLKLRRGYRALKLGVLEKELLIAAASSGEFYLLSVGQAPGVFIRAGTATYPANDSDPAFAAHCRDAFKGLIRRGYVQHDAGVRFLLNGDGFDKARSLASNGG